MSTTDPTTPALLSAARLDEIRSWAAEAKHNLRKRSLQLVLDVEALLRHLDALTAPADGEAERAHVDAGKPSERVRTNANTREQRVQRLARIAGELLQIGEDTVSEYLARDATIASLTAALDAERALTTELRAMEAEALASADRWRAASERHEREAAEARAAVESFQRGSGCIDGYTIGEALAKIGASLDRTPTEGIPDAIARIKREHDEARREGAREERRLCVLDVRREMASQEKASVALRVAERAMLARGDEPTPVEDQDGAT